MLVPTDGRHAQVAEEHGHEGTAEKHGEHGSETADARDEQDDGTQGDGNDAGFADGTGDKTDDHVRKTVRQVGMLGSLGQRCGLCVGVGQHIAQAQYGVAGHPYAVAAHHRGIGEEHEGTCGQGHIEDVHAGAAEDFLDENHRKSHGDDDNPQWTVHRQHHGDEDAAHEIAFLDFLALHLCPGKLDAQTHDITHQELGQHGQETI